MRVRVSEGKVKESAKLREISENKKNEILGLGLCYICVCVCVPEPDSGFNLKTRTRSYCLSDRVKPDTLGSSQAKYPRVGLLLPSLIYARCGTHHIPTHII